MRGGGDDGGEVDGDEEGDEISLVSTEGGGVDAGGGRLGKEAESDEGISR
jgi:hypothetical protein